MKRFPLTRAALACSLAAALVLPVSAFPWSAPAQQPAQPSQAGDNQPPIARNMELTTYKNVAITGYFDALDADGDVLTFQLVSTPARGSVELAEDGSSRFVYTPYDNKTGKDSFQYVAVDPAGNTSAQAKVSIRIEKSDTKVNYSDMTGDPAHKASIRLAEKDVFVGDCRSGQYFFQPDQSVSRAEFLALAMEVSGLEPMEGVTLTGFADDGDIPSWCKGYVSSALKAGVIQGSRGEQGQCIFLPWRPVTMGEATVMLNNLLEITDVPVETFSPGQEGHWASQSAANLASAGVLRTEDATLQAMSTTLTRSSAALLLDGALDVLANRHGDGLFFF